MLFNFDRYFRGKSNNDVSERSAETFTADVASVEAQTYENEILHTNVNLTFYRSYYSDLVELSDIQLEEHWKKQGAKEGRFANPEDLFQSLLSDERVPDGFNIESYIRLNPDLNDTFDHPFEIVEHFINTGIMEKRQYRSTDLKPSVFFDAAFYQDIYKDLSAKSEEELVNHWTSQGKREGRFGSSQHALLTLLSDDRLPKDFSVETYLELNPDLAVSVHHAYEAVDHFLRSGFHEGRAYLPEHLMLETDEIPDDFISECELLDKGFYRELYPDLKELTESQLEKHWYFQGKTEGRYRSADHGLEVLSSNASLPSDFDAQEYIRLNPDIRNAIKYDFQAIHHYLEHGIHENRCHVEPGVIESEAPVGVEKFDADFYRVFYPDFKNASDELCLEHYLSSGHIEGRKANLDDYIESLSDEDELLSRFNLPTYIRKNPDLIGHFENKWQYFKHYLHTGRIERRSYAVDQVCMNFIHGYYGLELESCVTPSEALSKIRTELQLSFTDTVFLNEQELANFYGFRFVGFLSLFDHEAYVYANGETNAKLMDMTRPRCLEHFLVEGYRSCPIISYEQKFDPSFYGNEYRNSLMHLVRDDDLESEDVWVLPAVTKRIYEHWIRHGIHEGKLANLSGYVYEKYKVTLPKQVQNDVECYRALSSDGEQLKMPSHAFQSFLSHGIEERKYSETHNLETCEFYCAVAHDYASKGRSDVAIRLYEAILVAVPDFPRALHNLGDELLKSKFYRRAIECYEQLISNGTATEWSFLNLSECYKYLNLYTEAAKVLKQAVKVYPADVFLSSLSKDLSDQQLNLALEKTRTLVKVNRVDEGSRAIRDALSIFNINRSDELVSRDTGNIAIIGNHDLPQCRFYRIDQKYDLLLQAGYNIDIFKHTETLADFYSRLKTYEAVIFYRVPAIPSVIKAINATNIEGIPSIYDVDDLIFDVNLFPPSLESYAGQISREVHGQLTVDTNLTEHAIKMCEFGIASTSSLAEHMKRYVRSGQVSVLFNGLSAVHNRNIGLSESMPRKIEEGLPVTIFYGSGTKAHKDDFHNIVEPVFCRIHEKYGDSVRFLVMGHISMTGMLKNLGNSLTLIEPVSDIESYWEILRSEADINLAVLTSNEVTDTKSEIKWLEAGMFGIPSVVSSTATYQEVVKHESTGFICEGSDDFYNCLELLIESPDTRVKIGANAKADILSNYNVETQSKKLSQAIQRFKSNAVQDKMRVAIVNVFYPPEAIGGATRVVHDNVLELKQQFGDSIEIQVFCTTAGTTPYETKEYELDGVTVTAVACPDVQCVDRNMSDTHMGFAFSRFLKDYKPDLVHFHCIQRLTESIVSEARRLDIPYVITAHDGWWVSDNQFLVDAEGSIQLYSYGDDVASQSSEEQARAKKLYRELQEAERILAVSRPFEEIYKSAGLKNITTIENGVSGLKRVDRTPSTSGKIRLAHIGGMERHKGLHILKNVLVSTPQIDNVELLVIDHGAAFGSIRKEIWGSTEVTFRPKTLQSGVAELYSEIDVLVAPSVWPESYGLVTREALFCGCWVIASDRGCIGGPVLENENGFVVSVDNINELRDCLLSMNSNPGRYTKVPSAKLELRSSRDQAKDLFKLYSDIVEKTGKCAPDSDESGYQQKVA